MSNLLTFEIENRINPGKEYSISENKKTLKISIPYDAYGNGMKNRKGERSMDSIKYIFGLNKKSPESKVLEFLLEKANGNLNTFQYRGSKPFHEVIGLSNKYILSKGVSKLKKDNIIKANRGNKYMINPRFRIPVMTGISLELWEDMTKYDAYTEQWSKLSIKAASDIDSRLNYDKTNGEAIDEKIGTIKEQDKTQEVVKVIKKEELIDNTKANPENIF